jgi:pimeloyl-ACP methyl ester carboxylesterase
MFFQRASKVYFLAKVLFVFLFLTLNTITSAQADDVSFENITVQPTKITLSENRVLFTQIVKPASMDKTTFLFLPGINRSVMVEEPAVQKLIKKGYGAVTFNFSTQPLSVALLDKNQEPYFLNNNLTLEDFALETEMLAEILKNDYGIKNIIPVSLSYSGAVSIYLKKFPMIIETAPMTSTAAAHPQAEAFRKNLILSQLWNPIFGPGIVRATLDSAYRSNWSPKVDSIAALYGFEPTNEMIEGYSVMSRASEGFSWVDADVAIQGQRLFLVAENDASELLNDQISTFEDLKIKGEILTIKNSGHVIPVEQPDIFADILEQTALKTFGK